MLDQVKKMQQQLTAINNQEQHLSAQATAAKEAAEAARDQAEQMLSQSKAQWNSADAMVTQAQILARSVVETRKLVKAAEDSAKTAKEALRIGTRAVIGVKATTIVHAEADEWLQIDVVWENTGNATARHCYVMVTTEVKETDQPTPFFEPQQKPTGIRSLAIHGLRHSRAATLVPITEQQLSDVFNERAWLFAYGFVGYDNGRGDEFFTEYCARFDPKVNRFGEMGDFNDAT